MIEIISTLVLARRLKNKADTDTSISQQAAEDLLIKLGLQTMIMGRHAPTAKSLRYAQIDSDTQELKWRADILKDLYNKPMCAKSSV